MPHWVMDWSKTRAFTEDIALPIELPSLLPIPEYPCAWSRNVEKMPLIDFIRDGMDSVGFVTLASNVVW